MNKVWMDINSKLTGVDAAVKLCTSNDKRYWNPTYGIKNVDPGRWRDAQKQELEYWFMHSQSAPEKYFDYKLITRSLPSNLGKIIEIGCGPYPQVCHINKKMQNITLLDPLIENYAQLPLCPYTKGKLGDYIPDLLCDSAETLMLSEEYDTVLCFACLEHVSNAELVLNNLLRIVKPGGLIVIMERVFDGITPDTYYDRRRPIKLYKQLLVDWAGQLTVVKQSWYRAIHQYDQSNDTQTLVGLYRKPKYPR